MWSPMVTCSRPDEITWSRMRRRSPASGVRNVSWTDTPTVICSALSVMSDPPEECGQCLAAADAHGDDAELAVGAGQVLRDPDAQDRSGGTDRVAQRDGTAVGIGPVGVELRVPDDRHR